MLVSIVGCPASHEALEPLSAGMHDFFEPLYEFELLLFAPASLSILSRTLR